MNFYYILPRRVDGALDLNRNIHVGSPDHLHRRCSALVHCTKVSLTKDTTIFFKSPTLALYLGLQIRDCSSNIVTSVWQSWFHTHKWAGLFGCESMQPYMTRAGAHRNRDCFDSKQT